MPEMMRKVKRCAQAVQAKSADPASYYSSSIFEKKPVFPTAALSEFCYTRDIKIAGIESAAI